MICIHHVKGLLTGNGDSAQEYGYSGVLMGHAEIHLYVSGYCKVVLTLPEFNEIMDTVHRSPAV